MNTLPQPSAAFKYPLKHLILSHSSSTSYGSCARKLEFAKFYGVPKHELDENGMPVDNFAADVGKCLHTGYQNYLVNQDEQQALWQMALKYPVFHEAFQNNSFRSLEATISTLLAMIRSPISSQYELIQIKTKDGVIRPAVEVPYVIEFTDSPLSVPVYHVGLIDAILYDKVKERYIVCDIKTHRDNTNDLSLRYRFDQQTIPYGLILEHVLGHEVSQFTTAYMSCYVDLMEPVIRMYDFQKSRDDIRDWYIGQCDDLKSIAFYMDNAWFPRTKNGSTCMAFRKRCGFEEVCNYRDPKALRQMITGEPREEFFHDGQEPWIMVKLPYLKELVG